MAKKVARKPKTGFGEMTGDDHTALMEQNAKSMNPPEKDGEKDKPAEPTVADLIKQLGALGEQVTQLKDQNLSLMQSTPRTPQAIEAPKPISYDNLPDASLYPEKYGKELAERMQKFNDAKAAFDRAQQSDRDEHTNRLRGVVEDIKIALGEDVDEDRIDFVASQVIKKAERRGIDKERYVFNNRDRFIGDVKKEFYTMFPKHGDDDETDDGDDGRATVTGGHEGGLPQARDTRKRPETSDFMRELQEVQRKTGLF